MNNTNPRQDREISAAQSLSVDDTISSLISIIDELDDELTNTRDELSKAEEKISSLEDQLADAL